MVTGCNCGVGHWPGGGVAEFRVEEEGVRRLGAKLLDHLLGCGTQDVGHDGLERVGGLFHWFVSFEELRRPKSEKPPVGAALGVARAGLFVVSCVVGSVSRQSCVCFRYADDLGAVETSEITPTWDRGIMPALAAAEGGGIYRGRLILKARPGVFFSVEVPERPQHQRRTGFPANDPACAGAVQGRLSGARRCPVSGYAIGREGRLLGPWAMLRCMLRISLINRVESPCRYGASVRKYP